MRAKPQSYIKKWKCLNMEIPIYLFMNFLFMGIFIHTNSYLWKFLLMENLDTLWSKNYSNIWLMYFCADYPTVNSLIQLNPKAEKTM